jgi:hypothetical protein
MELEWSPEQTAAREAPLLNPFPKTVLMSRCPYRDWSTPNSSPRAAVLPLGLRPGRGSPVFTGQISGRECS